jgi:hypothetical protein
MRVQTNRTSLSHRKVRYLEAKHPRNVHRQAVVAMKGTLKHGGLSSHFSAHLRHTSRQAEGLSLARGTCPSRGRVLLRVP